LNSLNDAIQFDYKDFQFIREKDCDSLSLSYVSDILGNDNLPNLLETIYLLPAIVSVVNYLLTKLTNLL